MELRYEFPPPSKKHKFGAVVIGDINGITYIIAPAIQGRFSEERTYTVGKGSWDETDTDPSQAAFREYEEETGINRDDLDLLTAIDPTKMQTGVYPASSGDLAPLSVIPVEVSNMAELRTKPTLKGRQVAGKLTTAVELASKCGLPDPSTLLTYLNEELGNDKFSTVEAFEAFINDPSNKQEMQLLGYDKAYQRVYKRVTREHDALVGDDKLLKIDTKVQPLHWTVETAEVVPLGQYVDTIVAMGRRYPQLNRVGQGYVRSMLGDGQNPGQLHIVLEAIAAIKPEAVEGIDLSYIDTTESTLSPGSSL